MLKVINLSSGYHSLPVIHSVALHAQPGEIITLIGANGAGKSTLLKTIAGLLAPTAGRVLFHGKDLFGWPANRVASTGLMFVPEGRGLFVNMSVLDNLRMGGYPRKYRGRQLQERIEVTCAEFPVLRERLQERAGDLSGGQQQMLALGRALVGDPEVLLLDEPSTGLAPLLVKEIFSKIQLLKSAGKTIILAEQHIQQALLLADRAYVLKNGRIVLDGPAAVLLASDEIKRAYLGC